jgi:hypothetical protein
MQKSLMHVSELTEIFFEDAITAGLEQSGYVLLNLRGGVGLANERKYFQLLAVT